MVLQLGSLLPYLPQTVEVAAVDLLQGLLQGVDIDLVAHHVDARIGLEQLHRSVRGRQLAFYAALDGADVLGHGHDAGGILAVGRAQHGLQLFTADRQAACGDLGKDAFLVRLQTVFQICYLLAQSGDIFLQAAARGLERVPV